MVQTLLKTKDYGGKYVALKNFKSHTVVASGTNPNDVYKKALDAGCKDPVITYVPVKGMVQIY